MQPIITRRRKFIRAGSYRHGTVKRGDIIGYECGDCHARWGRFQDQKHKDGCPRALRNSLEHKTTKEYFKRPARVSEKKMLREFRGAVLKLMHKHGGVRRVLVQMVNSSNPNGWSFDVTRDGKD